ncbi:caspase, EACC1-associated type [Actinoplanes regularis]|uniref:WD40 repeat n=1 Tax=Actinoplanes regularis TaxID=52697 RepID=A0A238UTX9_9ACTN|nr:caspase family protein [Actinoplanes regularis]GIE84425.1 hypothetical protein Are01nite_09050 [Actinoplanes regularis]SNR25508.1 WD40 repeat [Actinoplanes regularis]
MRLPDPRRSNVVIIGTSRYRAADLPDLPGVWNNVNQLKTLFTDPRHGIVPDTRCRTILDPIGMVEVYRVLQEQAKAATDTLLFYFAGHGEIDDRSGLCLSMTDTDRDALAVSALRFESVRELLNKSPAQHRIVILDCCFSGRALHTAAADDGIYVLTATSETVKAEAPVGQTYTAFSGELIRLLRDGVDGGPEMLTIDTVYRRLRDVLSAKDFPKPANLATGSAADIVIGRNRWAARKPAASPVRPAAVNPVALKPAVSKPVPLKPAVSKPVPLKPAGAPRARATNPKPAPKYGALPRLMFSPDSGTLVAAGPGGLIRVWDVASRRMRHRLPCTMLSSAHCVLGLHGTALAVTGRDDAISVWNVTDGRQRSRIDASGNAVACHPTRPLLAAVTRDFRINLWNLRGGERIRTLSGHTGAVSRVSFSPDGTKVLSTGQDGTLRIWEVSTGRRRTVVEGLGASPRRIAVHAEAGWVASTLPDGRIRLFSLASGNRMNDLPTGGDIVELHSTHDGRALAVLDSTGRIRLYDVTTGRACLRLPADPEPASRILIGPGRMFATVAGTGPIQIRGGRDGEVLHVLRDGGNARYLRFAPDGRHLALGGRDSSVRLYDLRDGRYLPLREKPVAQPVQQKRARVLETAGLNDRSWLTRWGIGPIEL